MDKDKIIKLITKIGFVTLFFIYSGLLYYDFYFFDDNGKGDIIEQHKTNLQSLQDNKIQITGLILGGSNAIFGFSAEQLSENLEDDYFYNLALLNQGYSSNNYLLFLKEMASIIDSDSVRIILFSDLYIYSKKSQEIENNLSTTGRASFSFFPQISLISHIKNIKNKERRKYSLNKKLFGDFDFKKFNCKSISYSGTERGDIFSKIKQSIYYQDKISEIFPKAKIYFVTPTLFRENVNVFDDYLSELQTEYEKENLHLIIQNHKSDLDFFCDTEHHPNFEGRKIRTAEILELIRFY